MIPPADRQEFGSLPSQQLPPPGWYAEPSTLGLRWWDGSQWTEHRAPMPSADQPGRKSPADLHAGGILRVVALVLAIGLGLLLMANGTTTAPDLTTRECCSSEAEERQYLRELEENSKIPPVTRHASYYFGLAILMLTGVVLAAGTIAAIRRFLTDRRLHNRFDSS